MRLRRIATRHQHVAELVQHRREQRFEALDRHVAAALENLGFLGRNGTPLGSFGVGRVQTGDGWTRARTSNG